MTRLADRTARIAGSPTMKVTATVDRLRREGVAVIDFGAGEPDFGTPEAINVAAKQAIDQHFSKYTPVGGTADLKRAIVDRYRLDYGVEYQENQVITCAGGKQALFNAALTLFGPGDEVITHAPYWPTLTEQVKLADATPVLVRTTADDGFGIAADAFIRAITPRTRGIIINSPCNPTGALISEEELAQLAQETARRGIWLVLDLCYEKLIYDPVPHNLPAVLQKHSPDLVGRLRLGLEGVRDDGMALRLVDRAGRCDCGATRAPESRDLERFVDHSESGGRSADRFAGAGHADARRVSPAPRRAARLAHRRSAHPLRQAGRRVLLVSRRQRMPGIRRLRDDDRLRPGAARRGPGRGHARRSVRRAGIRSPVVRHVDG